jgi:hypothetical protein
MPERSDRHWNASTHTFAPAVKRSSNVCTSVPTVNHTQQRGGSGGSINHPTWSHHQNSEHHPCCAPCCRSLRRRCSRDDSQLRSKGPAPRHTVLTKIDSPIVIVTLTDSARTSGLAWRMYCRAVLIWCGRDEPVSGSTQLLQLIFPKVSTVCLVSVTHMRRSPDARSMLKVRRHVSKRH